MAISTYLLIITLNVSGLNAPRKRHKGDKWIIKHDPCRYMLLIGDSLQMQRHIQTENDQKEKNIFCTNKLKYWWGSNSLISQNRLLQI